MPSPRPAFLFLAGLLLVGPACQKERPQPDGLRYHKGLPYYYFTTSDQPWLQPQQGDVWRFANARGQQRAYEVSSYGETRAANKEFSGPGILSNSAVIVNYYDYKVLRLNRTDSSQGGGELRFYRDAALRGTLRSQGYDEGQSRFYAEGEWYTFVGNTDLRTDYYSCRGLKFPSGPAANGPFDTLTVGGRRYTEVISFIGTSRGPDCASLPSWGLQELYYDRRAGLVRLVSLAGERWDRVP